MGACSLPDIILLCLSGTAFVFCLSSAEERQYCYGRTYRLPFQYSPRVIDDQLFFTPSNGGEKRIVIKNHTVQDPRFITGDDDRLVMPGLTEQDSGVFSIEDDDDVITLVVKDCHEPETKNYGDVLTTYIPEGAEFLEFTPDQNPTMVTVVWNHRDSKGSIGSVDGDFWQLSHVTQEHSGYYKFRGKKNKLVAWKRLKVREYEVRYVRDEGGDIYMAYPEKSNTWTVIFSSGGEQYTLQKEGMIQTSGPFGGRIESFEDSLAINPLQHEDSGTFEFRDVKGNLAKRVVLVVNTSFPPALYYVIIAGGLFLLFGIYCCAKKCCCKKRSSKRNNPARLPEAAPAVHYHNTTQHTDPQLSGASPAPVPSYQPTFTTNGPPVYDQMNVGVNLAYPEAAAPGGQGATPLLSNCTDFISSDSDPRFEMKGLFNASAPPLNSDTTICDVYSSDKLNFL